MIDYWGAYGAIPRPGRAQAFIQPPAREMKPALENYPAIYNYDADTQMLTVGMSDVESQDGLHYVDPERERRYAGAQYLLDFGNNTAPALLYPGQAATRLVASNHRYIATSTCLLDGTQQFLMYALGDQSVGGGTTAPVPAPGEITGADRERRIAFPAAG